MCCTRCYSNICITKRKQETIIKASLLRKKATKSISMALFVNQVMEIGKRGLGGWSGTVGVPVYVWQWGAGVLSAHHSIIVSM
jgi:hypothetical protein